MIALALLVACRTTCPEGQQATPDGACADAPDNSDAYLDLDGVDLLPACEAVATPDRLDLVTACADGVCALETYATAVAAAGEGACDNWGGDEVECSWSNGAIVAWYPDWNADDVPDDDEVADAVYVFLPWDGGDEHGHGLGGSMLCWLEHGEYPFDVDYADGMIVELDFDRYSVEGDTSGYGVELQLYGT
jgi:hypothetical protein